MTDAAEGSNVKPVRRHHAPGHDAIEAQAAAWLTHRDEGMSRPEEIEFARWRAADARHEAAVVRLEETWQALQGLRSLQSLAPARPGRARLQRGQRPTDFPMNRLTAVAGLAALVMLAAIGVWWRLTPDPAGESAMARQTHTAPAGGIERVTLADGSVALLNTNSEIRVAFTPTERRILLVRGEAHFTVTTNPDRPFVVETGAVEVRAVGTAFDVRTITGQVQVLVTEGRVRIDENEENATDAGLFLDAGHRATLSVGAGGSQVPVVEVLGADAIRQALAWQDPPLQFVETPLGEVIAQLNQRNRVQIVLGDTDLASLPIGGSLRAGNVEAFVRLLAADNDLVIERPDSDHIVLRRK